MPDYKTKYLKYKNKYIQLRKNFGGASSATSQEETPTITKIIKYDKRINGFKDANKMFRRSIKEFM